MSTATNQPSQSSNPVGAVMVVGGGIGGMQASLDLAEQGYKVYLVEKETAIGGKWRSWIKPSRPMIVPCAPSLQNLWR